MNDKALVQVKTNDITPVILNSEDSNQISEAELALFSLEYANKIKQAVDNPAGGSTLKGYDALPTIKSRIEEVTNNKATLLLEKSYAEVVTNGEYIMIDFVLWISTNGNSYYTPDITIQLDNPTEKIMSGHIHYINSSTYFISSSTVQPTTSYPAASIYFDQELNKIIFTLNRTNISNSQYAVYNVSIPIFPNVVPPVTQTTTE